MDRFSLKGKRALVTGGTRGIGQAIVLGLAEAGADIVLVQREPGQLQTKEAVEGLGRMCHVVEADLSDRKSVMGLVPAVTKQHRVDILVNVAGIMHRCNATDFTENIYDEIMKVNLDSTFFICRDMGKYWIENKIKGRLINTASLATFQGGVRMAAYSASKGAIGQLTKALSNEWAPHGIRVNAIAPGYIATDMNIDTRHDADRTYFDSITARIPMGEWGTPDHFKGPAVFLASDASAYISGNIMVVDGGWMAR